MDLYLWDPRTTLLIHFIYTNISIEYKKSDRKQFFAKWQELATTYLVNGKKITNVLTLDINDLTLCILIPNETYTDFTHQVSLVPTLKLEKVHWCTFLG